MVYSLIWCKTPQIVQILHTFLYISFLVIIHFLPQTPIFTLSWSPNISDLIDYAAFRMSPRWVPPYVFVRFFYLFPFWSSIAIPLAPVPIFTLYVASKDFRKTEILIPADLKHLAR